MSDYKLCDALSGKDQTACIAVAQMSDKCLDQYPDPRSDMACKLGSNIGLLSFMKQAGDPGYDSLIQTCDDTGKKLPDQWKSQQDAFLDGCHGFVTLSHFPGSSS